MMISLTGVEWVKWGLAYEVLCDKNVLPRLKGKFYRVVTCTVVLGRVLGHQVLAVADKMKKLC